MREDGACGVPYMRGAGARHRGRHSQVAKPRPTLLCRRGPWRTSPATRPWLHGPTVSRAARAPWLSGPPRCWAVSVAMAKCHGWALSGSEPLHLPARAVVRNTAAGCAIGSKTPSATTGRTEKDDPLYQRGRAGHSFVCVQPGPGGWRSLSRRCSTSRAPDEVLPRSHVGRVYLHGLNWNVKVLVRNFLVMVIMQQCVSEASLITTRHLHTFIH